MPSVYDPQGIAGNPSATSPISSNVIPTGSGVASTPLASAAATVQGALNPAYQFTPFGQQAFSTYSLANPGVVTRFGGADPFRNTLLSAGQNILGAQNPQAAQATQLANLQQQYLPGTQNQNILEGLLSLLSPTNYQAIQPASFEPIYPDQSLYNPAQGQLGVATADPATWMNWQNAPMNAQEQADVQQRIAAGRAPADAVNDQQAWASQQALTAATSPIAPIAPVAPTTALPESVVRLQQWSQYAAGAGINTQLSLEEQPILSGAPDLTTGINQILQRRAQRDAQTAVQSAVDPWRSIEAANEQLYAAGVPPMDQRELDLTLNSGPSGTVAQTVAQIMGARGIPAYSPWPAIEAANTQLYAAGIPPMTQQEIDLTLAAGPSGTVTQIVEQIMQARGLGGRRIVMRARQSFEAPPNVSGAADTFAPVAPALNPYSVGTLQQLVQTANQQLVDAGQPELTEDERMRLWDAYANGTGTATDVNATLAQISGERVVQDVNAAPARWETAKNIGVAALEALAVRIVGRVTGIPLQVAAAVVAAAAPYVYRVVNRLRDDPVQRDAVVGAEIDAQLRNAEVDPTTPEGRQAAATIKELYKAGLEVPIAPGGYGVGDATIVLPPWAGQDIPPVDIPPEDDVIPVPGWERPTREGQEKPGAARPPLVPPITGPKGLDVIVGPPEPEVVIPITNEFPEDPYDRAARLERERISRETMDRLDRLAREEAARDDAPRLERERISRETMERLDRLAAEEAARNAANNNPNTNNAPPLNQSLQDLLKFLTDRTYTAQNTPIAQGWQVPQSLTDMLASLGGTEASIAAGTAPTPTPFENYGTDTTDLLARLTSAQGGAPSTAAQDTTGLQVMLAELQQRRNSVSQPGGASMAELPQIDATIAEVQRQIAAASQPAGVSPPIVTSGLGGMPPPTGVQGMLENAAGLLGSYNTPTALTANILATRQAAGGVPVSNAFNIGLPEQGAGLTNQLQTIQNQPTLGHGGNTLAAMLGLTGVNTTPNVGPISAQLPLGNLTAGQLTGAPVPQNLQNVALAAGEFTPGAVNTQVQGVRPPDFTSALTGIAPVTAAQQITAPTIAQTPQTNLNISPRQQALSTVANQFGQRGAGLSGDLNGDGMVDIADLVLAGQQADVAPFTAGVNQIGALQNFAPSMAPTTITPGGANPLISQLSQFAPQQVATGIAPGQIAPTAMPTTPSLTASPFGQQASALSTQMATGLGGAVPIAGTQQYGQAALTGLNDYLAQLQAQAQGITTPAQQAAEEAQLALIRRASGQYLANDPFGTGQAGITGSPASQALAQRFRQTQLANLVDQLTAQRATNQQSALQLLPQVQNQLAQQELARLQLGATLGGQQATQQNQLLASLLGAAGTQAGLGLQAETIGAQLGSQRAIRQAELGQEAAMTGAQLGLQQAQGTGQLQLGALQTAGGLAGDQAALMQRAAEISAQLGVDQATALNQARLEAQRSAGSLATGLAGLQQQATQFGTQAGQAANIRQAELGLEAQQSTAQLAMQQGLANQATQLAGTQTAAQLGLDTATLAQRAQEISAQLGVTQQAAMNQAILEALGQQQTGALGLAGLQQQQQLAGAGNLLTQATNLGAQNLQQAIAQGAQGVDLATLAQQGALTQQQQRLSAAAQVDELNLAASTAQQQGNLEAARILADRAAQIENSSIQAQQQAGALNLGMTQTQATAQQAGVQNLLDLLNQQTTTGLGAAQLAQQATLAQQAQQAATQTAAMQTQAQFIPEIQRTEIARQQAQAAITQQGFENVLNLGQFLSGTAVDQAKLQDMTQDNLLAAHQLQQQANLGYQELTIERRKLEELARQARAKEDYDGEQRWLNLAKSAAELIGEIYNAKLTSEAMNSSRNSAG